MAEQIGRRLFVPVDAPWQSFVDDVRRAIDAVSISYRVNRRVTGALHQETLYSNLQPGAVKTGKSCDYRHVRKPLQNMSEDEIAAIVDPSVRQLVNAKLEQIGGDAKKVFSDRANHPYLTARDGRKIFIHKARIRKAIGAITLGKPPTERFAAPGSNHHMEIVAVVDAWGNEKSWEAVTVNLMEAAQRVRLGIPVVRHDHGPGKKFKFSLAGGEYLELTENGNHRLVRVTVISGKIVEFRLHSDARPITLLRQTKGGRAGLSKPIDSLRKLNARKVVVDPLGKILSAND